MRQGSASTSLASRRPGRACMRWMPAAIALLLASFVTPAHAQQSGADGSSGTSCLAQMAATVGPLLQQASQFSPQGVAGQGFVPLAQPFAPGAYALPYGIPAPPSLAPPTAAFNASSGYTALAGLPPPGVGQFLNSQNITQYLIRNGQLNLLNPAAIGAQNPNLLVQLGNLYQTEQGRQQQQALLQQQQGLYLNSLYQLSSSYQITSLDWAEAYSGLAQAWMSYFRDLCGGGASGQGLGAGAAAGAASGMGASTTQNQPVPTYPSGGAPQTPPFPGVPGMR